MTTTKKLTSYYGFIIYWFRGLEIITTSWRAERYGVEYSQEELQRLKEARDLVCKAKVILNEIYSKRIGESMTSDIRTKTWQRR